MFKRELKVNLKSFIIWTVVLLGIFTVAFAMYPSIVKSNNIEMMDEMMQMFPKEILKALNMDIASIDTVFGWLKSEGFVFALLITGCFAGILGSNILLKEENDKTIEYLNSLPVTRTRIVCSKVAAGLIYVVAIVVILGIFNYVGLSLSGEFDHKLYFLMSITPLFSSLVIFFGCMFLSTFTHKTRKMLGISLGIVLVSYVLQVFASLSESTEFLKYFSVFSLADTRNVVLESAINPVVALISVGLAMIFFGLIVMHYNKKELV